VVVLACFLLAPWASAQEDPGGTAPAGASAPDDDWESDWGDESPEGDPAAKGPVQTIVPVAPAPAPGGPVQEVVPMAKPPADEGEAPPPAADDAAALLDEPVEAAGSTLSAEEAKQQKELETFVEGELASVGAVGLVPWENRFGIVIGIERLGEIFYAAIKPQINYNTEVLDRPFNMSFGIPFRLQLLDSRSDRRWDDAGTIRAKDWDEVSDWAQILRYITWGGKEKHLYLDINQFKANSIGHGTLMKRYNQNLNFNTKRVSAQFDAFMDYGGLETYINDITGPNVMGALVFLKPLSFIDRENYMLRSFSIGFSTVFDIDAPLRNKLDFYDIDDEGRRATEISIDQDDFQPRYDSSVVASYGVDVEVKLVDYRALDWKTYFDYSWLVGAVPLVTADITNPADPAWDKLPTRGERAGGFTWGNLFRMNLGNDPVHALRFRAEYRNYDPNYLPSYFDVLYEVQRYQYFSTAGRTSSDLANRTKLQQVLGRDSEGERVHGGYLEASWRVGHYFAFATGFELNNRTDDNNMFLHLEVPHIGRWQFMATYHRRTATGFSDLFKFFSEENTDLFMLKTRYGLGDILAVSLEALTPFGIGPESYFRSTVQVNLNVEFGFSY
jgi:hypothetical protein